MRFVAWVALLLLLLGASACAPTRSLQDNWTPHQSTGAAPAGSVDLRLIVVIHGDADYTYHDSAGARLRADREALKQVVEIATTGSASEVFIFHQTSKPTYYHFRSGILVHRETYFPKENAYLADEAAFLHRDRDSSNAHTVLAYFGHEIPSGLRKGYFASQRSKEFSLLQFSEGLSRLGGGGLGKPYDLVILSACYGGTPAILQSLTPLANQVVASPAYLHLSYLNLRALGSHSAGRAGGLADSVAAQSFAQLRTKTQTEITVGIYEVNKIQGFLESPVAEAQILRTANGTKIKAEKWQDCSASAGFDSTLAGQGVKLFYQPPRFGPLKNTATRSAWQCSY